MISMKRILTSSIAFLMTMNMVAVAEMPKVTAVIGKKAYDWKYVNDKNNIEEIRDAIKNRKSGIYVKKSDGKWYENVTREEVERTNIPKVVYKSDTKIADYAEHDGEEIILNVYAASFIKEDKIKIKFTKQVEKDTALNKNNYIIGGRVLGSEDSISLEQSGREVIITLGKALEKGNIATSIEILDGLKDLNSNPIPQKYNRDVLVINKKKYSEDLPKEINSEINIILDDEKYNFSNHKIKGNVYVNGNNVTVERSDIQGALYIDPGKYGNGYFGNVAAETVEILSGGINSIHFYSLRAGSLNINSDNKVRIESKGNTEVSKTEVTSSVVLDSVSGTYGRITVKKDEAEDSVKVPEVELRGRFNEPVVLKTGVQLKAAKRAEVSKVEVEPQNSNEKIKLKGDFEEVEINKEVKFTVNEDTRINRALKVNTKAEIIVDKDAQLNKLIIEPKNGENQIKLSGEFDLVEVKKESAIDLVSGHVDKIISRTKVNLNLDEESEVKKLYKKGNEAVIDGEKDNVIKIIDEDGKADEPEIIYHQIIIKNEDDSIKTPFGLLQMECDVDEVVWSVENLTGKASITSEGILKAEGNGTVIVKASRAMTRSTVFSEATKVINISNNLDTNQWKVNNVISGSGVSEFGLSNMNNGATHYELGTINGERIGDRLRIDDTLRTASIMFSQMNQLKVVFFKESKSIGEGLFAEVSERRYISGNLGSRGNWDMRPTFEGSFMGDFKIYVDDNELNYFEIWTTDGTKLSGDERISKADKFTMLNMVVNADPSKITVKLYRDRTGTGGEEIIPLKGASEGKSTYGLLNMK